ncbi:hypothetical protein O3P69_007793 [Scylla paramamosain]|uniref:Uncharacterized protein n=1 Tax=Scylla paramamosain TaxID=85552 RepID=A0AAW0SGP7_SCYPA
MDDDDVDRHVDVVINMAGSMWRCVLSCCCFLLQLELDSWTSSVSCRVKKPRALSAKIKSKYMRMKNDAFTTALELSPFMPKSSHCPSIP